MYFEAETYMNHPTTFGFGDKEALAEFCLALAHHNFARDFEKAQALEIACEKMKMALWEIVIKHSADRRPCQADMPFFLRKLRCRYNNNLVLYFFAKVQEFREDGLQPGAREDWKILLQTVNHSEVKAEFFRQIELELEEIDWQGNWILDLDI